MLSESNSLIIRENTGNFCDFDLLRPAYTRKNLAFSVVVGEIPYSTDQGILKRYQGILLADQGIFFE